MLARDVMPRPRIENKSLEEELRSLERARAELDARAPARALAVRVFPRGSMGIEASALRIETFLALGRRPEGLTLARWFLSVYPRSPAAMRVRSLLADSESGAKIP